MGFSLDGFLSDLTHQFSSGVSPTQSEKDAGTTGDQARAAAQSKNSTLSQDFHGEYLPPVVSTAMENFDGMSHDRIIKYRDSVVPSDMGNSVSAWQKLADTTNKKAESFRTDIEKLLDSGWSGATADSAKNSVRTYAEDVHSLQNAANLVANKLSDASATLTQVKGQIPDKAKRKSTSLAGILTDIVATPIGGEGATVGQQLSADHGRANNAQNEAREVMNNVYAKYLPEADTNVPKMPGVTTDRKGGPQGPSIPASTAQSYAPTYSSNNSGYGPSNSSGHSTGASNSASSGGTGTSTGPSEYSGSSGGQSSSLNLPHATTGTSTDPSGTSFSPNNTATAGYSAGAAGTTGGGGGLNTPGGGGAGHSVAGNPTGATNPGTNPAAAAANAKSAPGMTGMPHGGQKGKGEDDGEHQTPDYLRGVQEELLAPEPRLLPGGVIGGNYADE